MPDPRPGLDASVIPAHDSPLRTSVIVLVVKVPSPAWRRGRGLHLHRKERARVDRVAAAVGVGHLFEMDVVERDADADARLALGVVDEDEFAALGFREVAEEGDAVVIIIFIAFVGCGDC